MTIRTPNNSYYVSGASGGQNHTLPFGADRFEDDDLFVYVWNTSTEAWDKKTVTTHYTVSSTQVSFTSSHIPSTRVIVLRKTDVDEDFPKADFVAGASIKAQDLDNNQLQALRGIKELRDQKLSAFPSIAEDGTPSNPKMYANLDMNGYKVVNQPAGYITSTDILDGTIATADVADSAITAAKLASDSVTTAKIASDAVNGSKIADDSIDSEHYVDGSIDTAHIANAQVTLAKMAADSVDGSKIADNSINSEHYVDGSIDTAHIADAQVTTAKIANDAVTADKLANTAVTAGSYTAADITVDAQGRVTAASNGAIGTSEITDAAVTTAKIADANVTTAKIADNAVTTAKIADAELVELATMGGNTASALADLTQSEVQILDGATVTTAELNILDGVTATATELNQLDGNTLKTTGTDFTSSSQFPAASEIDARITARIDPLGGFEAIADEDSFPATAPPAGTVISIANANSLAVNSSGVGAGTRAGGSDAVVINGFPSGFNSTSLDDGIGLLVIATSTAHTYDFHRVVAKNEDVRQLSSDINDFKARYRIGSSNPTTDNDAGDLFFNTGTSKMLVYNATSSAWEEVQAVGDFFINTLSSSSGTGGGSATFNGTAYRFTLSNAPTYAQQLLVSINGVVQKPNSGTSQPSEGFAIDGGDIILAAAPATGSNAFFITIGSSVGIGTPSDNTISTAKLVNDAVTGAKIADDAIDSEHYVDGSIDTAHLADGAVTNAKVSSSAAIAGTKISPDFGGQNVIIGTSSTVNPTVKILGSSAHNSFIQFADGDSDNVGQLQYSHSSNALITAVNGSERLRIDSAGRIGIGTSSPSAQIHLNQSGTGSYSTLRLSNSGASGRTYEIGVGGSTSGSGYAGNLYFYDSTASAIRAVINSSGHLGIGTTSPNSKLTLSTGDKIFVPTGEALNFGHTDGSTNTERMRIDSSGRLLLNNTSARTDFFGATGLNALLNIEGTNNATRATSIVHNSNDPAQHLFVLGKTRGAAAGAVTVVADDDPLGGVSFQGADGAKLVEAARVEASVDGTPGTDDMPGRITFSTRTDGSSGTLQERIRIDSSGNVGIGATSPGRLLHLKAASSTAYSGGSDTADYNFLKIENTTNDKSAGIFFQIGSNGEAAITAVEATDGSTDIAFQNRGGGVRSEKMRMLGSGGLTFNGDTATANALDDYEEGTFTPTIVAGADDGSGGAVPLAIAAGRYTKIGNKVYVDIFIQFASGASSNGAHARIGNLPYSISNLSYGGNSYTRGGGTSSFHNTTNDITSNYGQNNTTYFFLYFNGGQNFVFGGADNTSLSAEYWIGTFHYHTDS